VSVYNDQINIGELWTRKTNGLVETSLDSLSAIFSKYQGVDSLFYNDLITNNIKNFDVFYDSIFIETENGYIIEKFYVDNDYNLYPYNTNSFFTKKQNQNTKYWFDENRSKIYFVDIYFDEQQTNTIEFDLKLKEFDCKTGFLYLKMHEKFYFTFEYILEWGGVMPIFEPPVISYNNFTKKFNISFIIRNNQLNMGLFSIMIEEDKNFEIDRVDFHVPSAVIDYENSYHISL
jgi:hypothetical protein